MKLSIITINYNNRTGLERTLQSVENQNTRDFEHVIIDGASTDGSAEDIRKYAENNPNVIWVSEPDSGIYNAMNKGAKLASGEYLLFLNSGDDLYSSHVVQDFNKEKITADIVEGYVMYIDPNGGKGRIVHAARNGNISFIDIYRHGVPHQGVFIARKLQLGSLYDETYQISADVHFFVKNLIINNCSYQELKTIVSNFYLDGISQTNRNAFLIECREIYHQLIPPRIIDDYKKITREGHTMLQNLYKFSGFRNFIIRLNTWMTRIYSRIISIKSNLLQKKSH